METRKKTTSGVLLWTPAPARTSPTSSVLYEDVWEDQNGDQAEEIDDFISQMDENGIIGLSGALEDVGLEESCSGADPEYNPGCYPTSLTSEVFPGGCKRNTPPEELSDHLSDVKLPGEDGQILSSFDDMMGVRPWTENRAIRRKKEPGIEQLAETGKYLDVNEEIKQGDTEGKSSDNMKKESAHTSTSGKLCAMTGLTEKYNNKRENKKIRSLKTFGPNTPADVSSHHCPFSQTATTVTARTLPHLLHFTVEEMATAPGIDAETFPEMHFTESLPDSHSSLNSSPRCPRKSERDDQKQHQVASICPEQVAPRTCSLNSRQNSDRNLMTHTVKTRTKAAKVNKSRKMLLTHHTPDFSKVEPRVSFPKSGYKPPKSKLSSKKDSLSPGHPVVFKSPADIVKEVFLEATDESPTPSVCDRAPASSPSSTVPQDFRYQQQVTTLLEQLQEDYNRLLTKYAEAENTIDRLRLQAKVNLYDLPIPRHSTQSGLSHNALKFMTLDFRQAQKADVKSASHPNGHSAPPTEQVDKILYFQADMFLQQLQAYQDILKREKLKPYEQMRDLSQLAVGLDSLERGYLLARDEHKRLQRQGAQVSPFDPERELEGLVYQCGLQMDELKEQVEHMQQEQPPCEARPPLLTDPTQSVPSSVPSERGGTPVHPQTPSVPLVVNHGETVEVEVSSVSEKSDEMEEDDEETLKSFCLNPVTGKHGYIEQDSAAVVDLYQSSTELPTTFDHCPKEKNLCSTDLRTNKQPGIEQKKKEATGNMDVQISLHWRTFNSDHQDPHPLHASTQQTSGSIPTSHRTSNHLMTLPGHVPSNSRRLTLGKFHSSSLSSLGEITASEPRNSIHQTGSRKVLPQNGIISPETDSGFVGSESSHLTPVAAWTLLHQRAPKRVTVHQRGKTEKHSSVSTASSASSASNSHVDMEPRGASQLSPDLPRRSRQGQRQRTFSCSPQDWVSQTEQTRVNSECGMESDHTHSVSEDRQSSKSSTSVHSSHPGSSPSMQYHHGDSLSALGFSQVVNRNDAIQSLQAEVTTLKEKLESCLRNKEHVSYVRSTPSAQDKYTPCYTSSPHGRPEDAQQIDVIRVRGEICTNDHFEEVRCTTRTRSASTQRQNAHPDNLTSTVPPQPHMSRCTQTSAAEMNYSYTNTLHNSRTHHKQHSDVSIQVSEKGQKPDSSCQAPLCPLCSCHHRGQFQRSVDGNIEMAHSFHGRDCPVCGRPNLYRSPKLECHREPHSSTYTSCQPAEHPDRAVRSSFVAAPPALLQCIPMCPPPVLLYSSPVYMSPSNSSGPSSAARGRGEVRKRSRRSPSADEQCSLDSSLNRAIRAARHMKHTSRRMAHSLATGLEYQELLTESGNY